MSEAPHNAEHDEQPYPGGTSEGEPPQAQDEAPADTAPESSQGDEAAPAPEETAGDASPPVESLMGLRDFLTVAPRHRSEAVTKAAHSALARWLALQGHDVNGFQTMAQWQELYAQAMRYTG